MAKWNANKIAEEVKKAEEENVVPSVPVSTPRPIRDEPQYSHQETIRRYDRG